MKYLQYYLTFDEGDHYSFWEYNTFRQAHDAIKARVMQGISFNSIDLIYGKQIKFGKDLNRLDSYAELKDSSYFVRAISSRDPESQVYAEWPSIDRIKTFLKELHDLEDYRYKDMQVINGLRLHLELNINCIDNL